MIPPLSVVATVCVVVGAIIAGSLMTTSFKLPAPLRALPRIDCASSADGVGCAILWKAAS